MSRVTVTPWTDELFDTREAEFASLVLDGVRKMTEAALAALRKEEIIRAAAPAGGEDGEPQEVSPAVRSAALAAWGAWVQAELDPAVEDAFQEGGALVVDALAEVYGQDVQHKVPPVPTGYAERFLATARNRMLGVGENVWKGIRRELVAGLTAGEGIPEMSERLENYASLSESRARTVARTEVISSANAGSYFQMLEAGIPGTVKEWLATDDHRTRLSHDHADDQAVPLTDEFQVEMYQAENLLGTEPMEFPGDPIATPANVINCRCSLAFSFDDDADVLTAAPWNEALHPRDSEGRFKNKLEIAFDRLKTSKEVKDWIRDLTADDWKKLGDPTRRHVLEEVHALDNDSGSLTAHITKIAGTRFGRQRPTAVEQAPTPAVGGKDKRTGRKAAAGKPVFLRVKTLFETDYDDGAIVAVRPSNGERLVWNGRIKRMELQRRTDAGTWETAESRTRGATMKAHKDEEGWFTPSMQDAEDTRPAPVAPAGMAPGFLRTQAVYGRLYSDGEIVAVHPGDGLEVRWDADTKRMLLQRDGETLDTLTRGALMSRYKDADGWFLPGSVPEETPDGSTSGITPVVDVPLTKNQYNTLKGIAALGPVYSGQKSPAKGMYTSTYPALERKGLIEPFTQEHPRVPGQDASWYRVTDKGHAALAAGQETHKPVAPAEVTTAHVPETPAQEAPVPADIPAVRVDDSIPSAGDLTSTGRIVGSHDAVIYRDGKTGKEWLFKPVHGANRFMALVDVATADLHSRAGLPTPATSTITIDGRFGSIQEMFPNSTPDPFGHTLVPSLLSDDDRLVIQQEQIFDWLIGNHDGHSGNFVRLADGSLVGVDKGQAFKFFGSDELDPAFKPNERMPAGNLLAQSYANGELVELSGVSHPEIDKVIQRLENIPDAEYRELLRPYAENAARNKLLARGGPTYLGLLPPIIPANDVDAFLDLAVERKNTLRQSFKALYTELSRQRKAVLKADLPAAPPIQSATSDGVPVRLDASTLDKTYSHGQIVASQPQYKERLLWDGDRKKFVLQSSNAAGTEWLEAEAFSKSAAVKYFSGVQGVGWVEPQGGKTHADIPVPLPHVAGTPKPKAPRPVATPFGLDDLDRQVGRIPIGFSNKDKLQIHHAFKTGGIEQLDLISSGYELFARLLEVQQEQRIRGNDMSLLTLMRVIEDAGSRLNGASHDPWPETAIRRWLDTPDGETEAGRLIFQANRTRDREPDAPTHTAEDVRAIPVPSPGTGGSSGYANITAVAAEEFFDDAASDLPVSTINTVRRYSASEYVDINSAMRGMSGPQGQDATEKDFLQAGQLQRAMRPLPQNMLLYRGAEVNSLGFPSLSRVTSMDLKALEGTVLTELGFSSTSISPDEAFLTSRIHFKIEAPKGTPALYISPISANAPELEMLIAAGTRYKIIRVEPTHPDPLNASAVVNITLRIVP